MQLIVKRYLVRASLLAGLSIFLGIALSALVYLANNNVKEHTVDLVTNRLPIFSAINELIADLSEQERIIYEYYRSQETDVFLESSKNIQRQFTMHLSGLKGTDDFAKLVKHIEQEQADIISLFNQFNQLMLINDDNWDDMRAVLRQISAKRIALLPKLKEIEHLTTAQVELGHKATVSQIDATGWLVLAYSALIVIIAAVGSRYIHQYVLTQAKSSRLALFSQRNPNPIFSLDSSGKTLFSNPACETLLGTMGLEEAETLALLPQDFDKIKLELATSEDHSLVIEAPVKDRVLQTSIYWHPTLQAYDIHIKDVTERVQAERAVKHLAFTSQETQLPNQYRLHDNLTDLLQEQKPFALGVIAIRHFNEKVATLGGEVLTALVRCFAKVMCKKLPTGVELYHISESEFAVVIQGDISELSIREFANSITDDKEQALVTKFGELFIETDLGFVTAPAHGDDAVTLLKHVHLALSVVSEQEHESYAIYNPNYALAAQKRTTMVDKLRHALMLDELFLVFQPQLCARKEKVVGIETLLRWRHNDSIISPAEFIPLAEKSGLIVPIGKWILEQAAIFTKGLIQQGYFDIVVAVNVSPRQFSHPTFIDTVKEVLINTGLPPENLELEITEGVFMHNEVSTLVVMEQLKTLGVKLSIDDFGTGYSSLSYLKRFPVDTLKIDQSFVRQCHTNSEDKAIINTVIGLGKNLGLSIVAEGVELEQHLNLLRQMDCDIIQGYYYSKPLLPDELIAFLANNKPNAPESLGGIA